MIGPLLAIGCWWILEILHLTNPIFLPDISDVIHALFVLLTKSGFHDTLLTTSRTLISFSIALAIAVPLGVVLAVYPTLFRMSSGLIDFLRSIPAPAIFPIFLLIFGIGSEAKIAAAAFVAFWVLLIQTIHAICHIPPIRMQVAAVYRLSLWKKLIYLLIPQTLPEMITGSKIAISLSLILIVVSEMFMTSNGGMGAIILNSYMSFQTDMLYAAILLVGIIGFLLNKVMTLLESRYIHWTGH